MRLRMHSVRIRLLNITLVRRLVRNFSASKRTDTRSKRPEGERQQQITPAFDRSQFHRFTASFENARRQPLPESSGIAQSGHRLQTSNARLSQILCLEARVLRSHFRLLQDSLRCRLSCKNGVVFFGSEGQPPKEK